MRVFILGLDGLECNIVQKLNLMYLKQKIYEKIEVPINKKSKLPSTPEVWASFLTGKHLQLRFGFSITPLTILLKFLRNIRKYVNLSLGIAEKIGKKAPMQLLEYKKFPELGEKTFLDLTSSKKINVPYYNYDNTVFKLIEYYSKERITIEEVLTGLKKIYEKMKKQLLFEINNTQDVNIVFAYMPFPDIFEHYLFLRPHKIKELYRDLNDFVFKLKSKIEEKLVFLIISDHGFDLNTGLHSIYGYYSSNVYLRPQPKKIPDFYNIIKNIVKTKNEM